MITLLRELRDLLDGIERDGEDFDQGAMDAAIAITERLIVACERPLPVPAVGACYSVPTPYSPAAEPPPPPPPKPKAKRPENQRPSLSNRKRKVAA